MATLAKLCELSNRSLGPLTALALFRGLSESLSYERGWMLHVSHSGEAVGNERTQVSFVITATEIAMSCII